MSESSRVGFGPRLGAYLIDGVLAGIIGAVLGTIAGASLGALFFGDGDMGPLAAVIGGALGTVAGMFLAYIIFMIMEGLTGQTPGKMILKIQVKNQDGSQAGTGALMLRALLKNINYVLSILAGVTGVLLLASIGQLGGLVIFIGCFFVLGAKKQAIHDLIGKTAVYKK